MIKRLFFLTCFLFIMILTFGQLELNKYNVFWDSPGADSWGSMPLGNGNIGINAWLDTTGVLNFYISKTDAWSENARLLKIGKLQLNFKPNPFHHPGRFEQELVLEKGLIRITTGESRNFCEVLLWVDAHHPVIHLDINSARPLVVTVHNDIWRTGRRELKGKEIRSAYGLINAPFPVYAEPDHVVEGLTDKIQWFHRNERSFYQKVMTVQSLDSFAAGHTDPLLYRTFGATVFGKELKAVSSVRLKSNNAKKHEINILVLTSVGGSLADWKKKTESLVSRYQKYSKKQLFNQHLKWWSDFWKRHQIIIHPNEINDSLYHVTQGYLLQRFINACGGRGMMPIKFNGSIFTVDLQKPIGTFPAGLDADFRNWGGCYWFQNTRLPYWSMLYSGDYEMMKPLFTMYMNDLPLAKFRTKKYYGHQGAYFPETMYFWGTWNNNNYGWDRHGKPDGLTDNKYIRYYWQSGIEIIAMMYDYFLHTQDKNFLNDTLIPFSKEIFLFYDQHYPLDENGKIRFDPAQSLETYWEGTVNPLPVIAGLNSVVSGFLELENEIPDQYFIKLCRKIKAELPDVPTGYKNGKKILLAGEKLGKQHNIENPELYAVFPYRLYGVGKPDLQTGITTYWNRLHKEHRGWQQDGVQAALLGLTNEAKKIVLDNFNAWHKGSRFPAFWGPNYDWVPDQDHGNVTMLALQNMLIQYNGKKIFLLPAWPEDWDVDFKVHAPYNTILSGRLEKGRLINFRVMPPERKDDVIFPNKYLKKLP